jgi:tetratricopeptide (TPR) repeat protein
MCFFVLEEISNQIVAFIAGEIETFERNRAILKPPNSLDAWEAYHRGLWHMYQYRMEDNDKARHFFERALEQDPMFSRAYAGVSFTHFQDAFQNWATHETAVERAYATATKGLMADERDPAAHWAMGRALWLRARHAESLEALTRSVELSPNFALGHYNLSFVHPIVGDAEAAIERSDYSRHLSPFDPMLFGMFGTRAMALARMGKFDEAADWAVKASGRPNAFPHIHALAACCLALADKVEQGRAHGAAARRIVPRYTLMDFFAAFPFESEAQAIFRRAAKRVGFV